MKWQNVYDDGKSEGESMGYDAWTEDIAVVNFFFKSPTVLVYKTERKMTFIHLVSQLGGTMGLCIGLSLISLVEILYWFFIRYFCKEDY